MIGYYYICVNENDLKIILRQIIMHNTVYFLLVYDHETGLSIVKSYDTLEESKDHADRVQALRFKGAVDIIKPESLYQGDGLKFVKANVGTGKVDDIWYKTENDFSTSE